VEDGWEQTTQVQSRREVRIDDGLAAIPHGAIPQSQQQLTKSASCNCALRRAVFGERSWLAKLACWVRGLHNNAGTKYRWEFFFATNFTAFLSAMSWHSY
jgi:hypothetical protein